MMAFVMLSPGDLAPLQAGFGEAPDWWRQEQETQTRTQRLQPENSQKSREINWEIKLTFSSWCSRFSLWHSIVISPSSSFICLPFLPLLGSRWNPGEAGAEADEVGEFKSSSQYTTSDGNLLAHIFTLWCVTSGSQAFPVLLIPMFCWYCFHSTQCHPTQLSLIPQDSCDKSCSKSLLQYQWN